MIRNLFFYFSAEIPCFCTFIVRAHLNSKSPSTNLDNTDRKRESFKGVFAMVKDIGREIKGNILWFAGFVKMFAVKAVGFMVSCWIIAGLLAISVGLPAYLAKTLSGISKSKEMRIETPKIAYSARAYTPQFTVGQKQVGDSVNFRNGIRESGNFVNELRGLTRAVASFANR